MCAHAYWFVMLSHLIGSLWSRECYLVKQNGVEMTCDGKLELTFGYRCSFLKERECVLLEYKFRSQSSIINHKL